MTLMYQQMTQTRCTLLIAAISSIALLSTTVYAQSDEMGPSRSHVPPSPSNPPPRSPQPGHHPPPPHQNAGNRHTNPRHQYGSNLKETDNEKKILAMTLPMIVIVALFGLAGCGVWYMLKRAKRGALCCLKPNLNYQHVDEAYKDEDEEEISVSSHVSGTPPDYTLTAIAPPVYQDALQDVIVSRGTVGMEYLHSATADLPPDYQEEAVATVQTAATPATPPDYHQAPATPPDNHQAPATPPDYNQAPATPPDYHQAPATPPDYNRPPATPPQAPSLPPEFTSSQNTRETSVCESDSQEDTVMESSDVREPLLETAT